MRPMNLLVVLAAAIATTPATAEPLADRVAALDAEARAHLRAGRPRAAIAAFKASNRLVWHRTNDCNVAAAYLGLGDPHRAWAFFDRCRRRWPEGDPPGQAPEPFPSAIADRLVELEGALRAAGHRRVELVTVPGGAELVVEGFDEDERFASPVTLYLPAGTTHVRARAAHSLPTSATLSIGPTTPPRTTIELLVDPHSAPARLRALKARAGESAAAARAEWEALLVDAPQVGRPVDDRLFAAELLVRAGRPDEAHAELSTLAADGRRPMAERARLALRAGEIARETGRFTDALATAERARSWATEASASAVATRAARLIEGLRRRDLGRVKLACDRLVARAHLDADPEPLGCDQVRADLAPGRLSGRVESPGGAARFALDIQPGQTVTVGVGPTFDPGPWPWVLGGVGVAAGAVSAYAYAEHLPVARALRDLEPGDRAGYDDLSERWRRWMAAHYTGLSVAALAGAGALTLWWLADDGPSVQVGGAEGGVGASLRGVF